MSQGDASPRRKGRAWRRGLAIAVAVVLAGLIATYALRKEIATQAARLYLENQGVTVHALDVTLLGTDVIEVRNVALGEAREVAVDRLRIEPNVGSRELPVHFVSIDGLALHLDLREDRPLFGSLQPMVERLIGGDAGSESGGEPATGEERTVRLPEIAVTGAKVTFETPSGPMAADLDGDYSSDGTGRASARATLALDSDLGRLQAKLDGQRAADGALSVTADLADGRLAWQGFAVGSFAGRLSVEQPADGAPHLDAHLDLGDLSYVPAEGTPLQLASGTLEAQGGLEGGTMALVLDGSGEHVDLKATAVATPGDGRQALALALALQGEARSAGGLTQFLALPGPPVAGGTLVVQAEGDASLPGAETPRDWQSVLAKLPDSRVTLHGDAILAEVALADGTGGISGHLPLSLELSGNQATLALTRDAALRVERPSHDSLSDIGVPDDLLPLATSGLNLSLASGGDLPFRLTSTPAWPPEAVAIAVAALASNAQGAKLGAEVEGTAALGDALTLERFDGSVKVHAEAKGLSFGGREARGITITLPLAADYDDDGLRLALTQPGRLRITQFGKGAPLRLAEPLTFVLDSLTLGPVPDHGSYRYSLQGREDGAKLALSAAESAPIDITSGALNFDFEGNFDPQVGYDAELAVRLAGLGLPGYDFTADAVAIDVALDSELRPNSSRFTLGPFQISGKPALTAPLMVTGSMKRKGAGYDLAGDLTLVEGETLAALTGRYGDDGTARITIDGQPLTFDSAGLQPTQLSPLLADLKDVSGTVEADGVLTWPRQPAAENGSLRVTGLSFSGPAKVSGLSLSLELDSLLPPSSPQGQRLTIASLEAGLPVEDITVDFALDPKPALAVAGGGFDLGGAQWRIEPATLDPASESNRIALATDDLDLATLFKLLGVDGLSGTGTLKGRLPVVFSGGDVIIEESRFEAQGPGVLSIRISALRSALAGSGEAVEAAVKALEDFRYENLSITLAKTAENDATVKLSTLGSNPDVLKGQPFQFNINLESNLTSVLNALKQGYSLSDDALKRAWKLRQ